MRFVDLSAPLDDDRTWAPWWGRNRIRRQSHRLGRLAAFLVFGVRRKHLRTGLGWSHETLKISTHGTTHVDAPWHYAPVCEGREARTIDQIPLEWFYGPGIVLDLRDKNECDEVSCDDLQSALAQLGHELSPKDIVLIRTGNDRLWGSPEYFRQGPGVSAEATRWLLEQGVRLTGIDAWGWDGPLARQARRARQANRSDVFWAAHFVGVDKEYCHIERLANLDKVPPVGFTVCAFPLKVRGGSAGPARVVALVDDGA